MCRNLRLPFMNHLATTMVRITVSLWIILLLSAGSLCNKDTTGCDPNPCQNGGVCVNDTGGYRCQCSQQSQDGVLYGGENCTVALVGCEGNPCQNGGVCVNDTGGYRCQCSQQSQDGVLYGGENCTVALVGCEGNPCQNGGVCMNDTGGYRCQCSQQSQDGVLYGGENCTVALVGCEGNPCQNEGVCVNDTGGYRCQCSQQSQDGVLYGGENCTVALVGCEGNPCQNGGACFPSVSNGRHGFRCSCHSGFGGSRCQTSTTFSFETGGYVHLEETTAVVAEFSLNASLSFRTLGEDGVLLQRQAGELLVRLELVEGRLGLYLLREGEPSAALELAWGLADGDWHSVEATLGGGMLGLRLLDAGCREGCEAWMPIDVAPPSGLESASQTQNTYLGGVPGKRSGLPITPPFLGCLQDVHVDSRLEVPGYWLEGSGVNVSRGCNGADRCGDSLCQDRGKCISRGLDYQCECHRPFEGKDCSKEYIAARFGMEGSESYAVFTVGDNPGRDIVVSMFVRTKRLGGLLLVLANSTSQYLRLWLEGGRVRAQVHDSQNLRGKGSVSDGNTHLVSVKMEENRLTLFQSGQEQGHLQVRDLLLQPGDSVYLGGLPEQPTAALFGGYFDGCLQDLRINTRRLQFYPIAAPVISYTLERLVNVTQGCVADNACRDSPCQNGGMCHSVWDNFTCTCPPNTAGARCQVVEWCQLSPCPSTAVCLPLARGFECISNATFHDDGDVMSFKGNGKILRNLSSISFSIRTRNLKAAILHAEKALQFITVSIQASYLVLELLSSDSSQQVAVKSKAPVSDGKWHAVELAMLEPTSPASEWSVSVDGGEPTTSAVASRNLDFLKEGVDVYLGGLGPSADGYLLGCLSTVEVGGIPLAYYGEADLSLPRPQEEQFVRTSPGPPRISGCVGSPVCVPGPCLNGGSCQDLFDHFSCTCPPAWAGPRCEVSTDACVSDPCVRGNCSTRPLGYECTCESGYTGARCEAEVDACQGHRCAEGATCLRGRNSYSCLCQEDTTGMLCRERIEEIPWYIEKIRRPKLPVSICGNEMSNYTCFNGGNCSDPDTSASRMCDCPSGFTGLRCEQEMDECKSNPCLNGGYCRNLVDKFHCICQMTFAGDVCDIDVSDIYFYVSMLLWQNLFQLLSYLVLRLEDEAEVEWGGNDD